jgi:hypothetical protein
MVCGEPGASGFTAVGDSGRAGGSIVYSRHRKSRSGKGKLAIKKEEKMRILKITASAVILTLSLMVVLGQSSQGSNESHKADLTGYEEVPAVSSTGTGKLRLKVNEDSQTIEYELSYENLEGTTTTASHIHLGQKGVNGGVIAFFCGGGGKDPCTPGSGTFTGTIVPADIIGPAAQGLAAGEFAEVLRALRAGQIYVNVHTNKHPGGEIRGQVK